MKKPYTLFKRRPQNVWYYRTPDNRTARSTGKKTKVQAEQYVHMLLTGQLDSDSPTPVTLQSFAEDFFVIGQCSWLQRKDRKGKTVSKQMAQMRRGHLTNHVIPEFGKRSLTSINEAEIDDWLSTLSVTSRTKNLILDTIRVIFKEAVSRGLLQRDPTESIDRFAESPKARDAFTTDDLAKLFPKKDSALTKNWTNQKYAALFTVLATTGLRLGEALALTWSDWQTRTDGISVLSINKALKNDRTIGTTKTGESRIAFVLEHLRNQLTRWQEQTDYKGNDDLIFPNSSGRPLQGKECLKCFRKALEHAGIDSANRNLVIHSFRHTFNTMYRNQLGDDVLRKFTGHTSVAMTDHYDHPRLDDVIKILSPHVTKLEKGWSDVGSEQGPMNEGSYPRAASG